MVEFINFHDNIFISLIYVNIGFLDKKEIISVFYDDENQLNMNSIVQLNFSDNTTETNSIKYFFQKYHVHKDLKIIK